MIEIFAFLDECPDEENGAGGQLPTCVTFSSIEPAIFAYRSSAGVVYTCVAAA